MYVADIRIEAGRESDETLALVQELIAAWIENGQVAPPWIEVWGDAKNRVCDEYEAHFADESFHYRLSFPAPNSLFSEYDSPDVTEAKSQLVSAGITAIQIDCILEKFGDSDACWCDQSPFYVFSPSDGNLGWDLRCGLCFGPVPRYVLNRQVPHSPEFDSLYSSWDAGYERLYQICTDGESGRRAAKKELSSLDSELTCRGRDICEVITAGSGTPAYYFLYRYGGGGRQSKKRRGCPSCSGEWLLAEPLFDYFYFKCDRCRLVSN